MHLKKLLQEGFSWNLNYCRLLSAVKVLLDPLDAKDDEVRPCVQVVNDLLSGEALDDPTFPKDDQHPDANQMGSKEMLCVSLVVVANQTLNLLNFDYGLWRRFFVEPVMANVYSYSLMIVDAEAYDWTMELALTYWLEAEILT